MAAKVVSEGAQLAELVKTTARDAGFDVAGCAPVGRFAELAHTFRQLRCFILESGASNRNVHT